MSTTTTGVPVTPLSGLGAPAKLTPGAGFPGDLGGFKDEFGDFSQVRVNGGATGYAWAPEQAASAGTDLSAAIAAAADPASREQIAGFAPEPDGAFGVYGGPDKKLYVMPMAIPGDDSGHLLPLDPGDQVEGLSRTLKAVASERLGAQLVHTRV
jgi:hypothetical protein